MTRSWALLARAAVWLATLAIAVTPVLADSPMSVGRVSTIFPYPSPPPTATPQPLVLPIGLVFPINCQFVLGFKTLHDAIPGDVGDCQADQTFDATGNAYQPTSKGLLAWRAVDNWTAFTNGVYTWVRGPYGVVRRFNTESLPFEPVAGGTITLPSIFGPPPLAALAAGTPTPTPSH